MAHGIVRMPRDDAEPKRADLARIALESGAATCFRPPMRVNAVTPRVYEVPP
jgi:hypothetical protein